MTSPTRWQVRAATHAIALMIAPVLFSSAVVGASTPEPSLSAPAEGAITYMHEDAAGNWQLWVACPDLTGANQIAMVPDRDSGWPVWSPDGSRVAFDSNRDDPDPGDDREINDIYTVDPDGEELVKLTDSTGLSGDAAYSPDGTLLAFMSDEGGAAPEGIFVMDASDGSGKRRITMLPDDASWDGAPRFSPDGERLVFTRDFSDAASALYVVGIDGTDLTRITPDTVKPGDAVWSPDGSLIVFEADMVNGRGDAWIVEPDGEGLRNLTAGPNPPGQWEGFSDPVWSPDGSHILVMHGYHEGSRPLNAGLATIRLDGTNLAYVGDGEGEEHQADWSSSAQCQEDV